MRFNPKARIDQSQIQVRRGGGGGGMRLPIPGGMGGGGGRGGKISLTSVLVVVAFVVLTQCMNVDLGGAPSVGGGDTTTQNECQTGADANKSDDCAIDLFTTSVQDYWEREFPRQVGEPYDVVQTVRFSGSTSSGCGQAASQMGPFYCPNDQLVYLDSTFFDDMLEGQLGAKGGVFSIGYVIAHEYGHHVEDQLGVLGRIRTQKGPRSDAVRVELMADCLAGMWAKDAQETTDADGQTIISDLSEDDIARALDAAQAVGDDRIQQRSGSRVDTDSFTHGSAAQRMKWFNIGLRTGSLKSCDTFATDDL